MVELLLDNTFPILILVSVIFFGVDYYNRYWRKNERFVEPETTAMAYFMAQRIKRGTKDRSNF